MPLALHRHCAVDVFADRLEDGQIHYGLVFALPGFAASNAQSENAQQETENMEERNAIRNCSDLDTRSRHGAVDNWWVGVPVSTLPLGQAVLLIPRTWLIRQGFLPWWVALMPYRAFAIRNTDALKRHVWLECSAPDAEMQERQTAKAA